MGAIVACRTAALGGHVEACDNCGVARVAYNSCRNRHCPKCQGAARAQWLAARQAELLPVPYFHAVFTLPAPVGAIAFQNKAAVYAILFAASAEAMTTLAANPRRLGAATMIEHTAAVASEPEPVASSPMEALSVVPEPESAAVRHERERIDAWIRNRLVDYPLAACLRCRTPIIAGQDWQEVSNGEARARFHRTCHAEWRAEQEAAARQALGLAG